MRPKGFTLYSNWNKGNTYLNNQVNKHDAYTRTKHTTYTRTHITNVQALEINAYLIYTNWLTRAYNNRASPESMFFHTMGKTHISLINTKRTKRILTHGSIGAGHNINIIILRNKTAHLGSPITN